MNLIYKLNGFLLSIWDIINFIIQKDANIYILGLLFIPKK